MAVSDKCKPFLTTISDYQRVVKWLIGLIGILVVSSISMAFYLDDRYISKDDIDLLRHDIARAEIVTSERIDNFKSYDAKHFDELNGRLDRIEHMLEKMSDRVYK